LPQNTLRKIRRRKLKNIRCNAMSYSTFAVMKNEQLREEQFKEIP